MSKKAGAWAQSQSFEKFRLEVDESKLGETLIIQKKLILLIHPSTPLPTLLNLIFKKVAIILLNDILVELNIYHYFIQKYFASRKNSF